MPFEGLVADRVYCVTIRGTHHGSKEERCGKIWIYRSLKLREGVIKKFAS